MDIMYRIGFLFGAIRNLVAPTKIEMVVHHPIEATTGPAALAVDQVESVESTPLVEIGPNRQKIEKALTRVQELTGIGAVTMRIYPSTGIVNSKLTVTNKRMGKQLGFTELKLDPMNLAGQLEDGMSICDLARMRAVNIVETLLKERLTGEQPAKAKKEERPDKRETPSPTPAPTTRVAPVNKVEPQVERNDRPVYIGKFVKAGFATRTTHGAGKGRKPGSQGSKSFSQFYVDYLDQNLDFSMNRVWGNDLERAVKEAEVENGNMIRITYLGVVPVEIQVDGKPEMVDRKSYEIVKL